MTFAEFYRWWASQLGDLIPSGLRRMLDGHRSTLCLSANSSTISAAASPQAADSVELPSDGTPLSSAAHKSLPKNPQRVQLTVQPGDYLLRRFTLPSAVHSNLSQAVGYQLPQQTPFSADQVMYACGEDKTRSTTDVVGVWLVAVPHRRVAGALQSLGLPAPSNPVTLDSTPNANEALTLSWRIQEHAGSAQRWLPIAGLGLIVLFGGVLALHLHNRQSAEQALEDELADVRMRAAQVGRLRDNIERTRTSAAWLQQYRQSAPSSLALLNTLSKQLDDRTWLQRFELHDQEISLSGISPSPVELIEMLEATPLLRNVRFDAAITQNRNEEGNRFNISARIEKAKAADGGGS